MRIKYSPIRPTENNGYRLSRLVKIVLDNFFSATALGESFEVILVNDASPDSTWECISHLAHQHSFVCGVDLLFNTGQHIRNTACCVKNQRTNDRARCPMQTDRLHELPIHNAETA